MKFIVKKVYENGSRDIACEFGHESHCGRGVKDHQLEKVNCYQCLEKAWHDAGKCAPDATTWQDCMYCGEEKK